MITTGIFIPEVVLKRLATTVAGIHRATAEMTLASLRKAYRKHPGSTIAHYFHVELTHTGAVKGFCAKIIDCSKNKFGENGFETDVQLLGRADSAARSIAADCGEFFLRCELINREKKG